MDLKVSFFYHDNLGGFSETLYQPGKDFTTYGVQQVADYVTNRVQFSGVQTFFDYARISDVANPRNVQVVVPQDVLDANTAANTQRATGQIQGSASGAAPTNAESDYASTALLVRRTGGNKFSNWWLRGIPDSVVKAGGKYTPFAKFEQDIAAFFAFCRIFGYNWKTVTGNVVGSPSQITGCINNGDLTAKITVLDNIFAGIPVNKHVLVRITGQVTPPTLNGQFTVAVGPTPNTCNTLKYTPIVGFQAGTGRMTFKTTGFQLINTQKVIKVSSRKAGRPFGVLVGRSKNRKSA